MANFITLVLGIPGLMYLGALTAYGFMKKREPKDEGVFWAIGLLVGVITLLFAWRMYQ